MFSESVPLRVENTLRLIVKTVTKKVAIDDNEQINLTDRMFALGLFRTLYSLVPYTLSEATKPIDTNNHRPPDH